MDMLGHSGHVVSPKKTKGKTMYMTIRKYQGCKDVNEVNRVATAELLPVLRRIAGMSARYGLLVANITNQTLLTIDS